MFVQSIDALYDTCFGEEVVERSEADQAKTLSELRSMLKGVIPGKASAAHTQRKPPRPEPRFAI
jgi:hypothetical protein